MSYRDPHADHAAYAGFHDALRKVNRTTGLVCSGFQRGLSALLDGELAESHTRSTLAHLESCGECAEFFHAVRLQALAHRDMAVPGSLARRLRRLPGNDLFAGLTDAEIVRRLASVLYELGKAYALVATDGAYLLRIAEEPVEIDSFAAGEAAEAAEIAAKSGAASTRLADLVGDAASNLHKAHAMLQEALSLKPRFAEARLYLGFVLQNQDKADEAAAAYRRVFLTTDRLTNRAHAAIQLGMIYDAAGEHRRALRIYRWVVSSGLVARQPEFAFVLYNIAVQHTMLGQRDEAVQVLTVLHTEHGSLWPTVVGWLHDAADLLAILGADRPCRDRLQRLEPAIFAA